MKGAFEKQKTHLAHEHDRRPSSARRWMGRVLALVVAVGLGLGLLYAWLPKPIAVDVERVQRGELLVSVQEDGKTRVKDRHVLSAPLSGHLSRIEADPGDEVHAGQVLARLTPLPSPLLDSRARAQAQAQVDAAKALVREARANAARARASVEFAKAEAARQRALHGQGVASARSLELATLDERTRTQELTSAQFAVKVADNELAVALAALGRLDPKERSGKEEALEVTSPIDGQILRVFQESEGVVQVGAPLLEVADPRALELVVDVLTRDAVDIRRGARATVLHWGGQNALSAHVERVEPSAFTRLSSLGVEEQRVNVILDLDEPYARWASLGDAYRIEARILLWQGKDALKIPTSALFRQDGEWAAFVVREGTAATQRVTIGRRGELEAEALSGVKAGDLVVVYPSDEVQDGTRVEVRQDSGARDTG